MARGVVVLVLAGCGRIAFDRQGPHDGGPLGPDGADGSVAACATFAATEPPAPGTDLVLVRAWGAAPDAPSGTPTTDAVELAWDPATLPSPGGYAVVRTQCGTNPDPLATSPCTATTTGSCLACATNDRHCVDVAALPSPARLRYRVIARDAGGAPIPPTDNGESIVDVAIPPPNMVLVHRGSVNREMCDLLGAAIDPTGSHACSYTGPGAVPLRAHPDSPDLSFPAGVYDFGYDLFVDRWETGCNWTHASDGGMCGPGATPGDCWANTPGPASTVGAPGNVFYASYAGHCAVRTAAGWADAIAAASLSPADAGALYTNAPGARHDRPPLAWANQVAAATICGATAVPGYGAKRLWRLREFVAAGAFERLPGDPAPLTQAQIQAIEAGLAHPSTHACNVDTHNGVAPSGFGSGDELARDTTISTDQAEDAETFVLGSVATSACTSRYGVQDLIGNVLEVVSDQLAPCGTGTTCVGEVSAFDAGNRDLLGYAFDGVNAPSFDDATLESQPKVVLPLALPSIAFGSAPDPAQLRGDDTELFTSGSVRERMVNAGDWYSAGSAAGRFATDFGGDPTGGNSDASWGMRCVVAAVPR